jgi:hypothetical protein
MKLRMQALRSVQLLITAALIVSTLVYDKLSYAQTPTLLNCEGSGARWEIKIEPSLQLIFTSMRIGSDFASDGVWKIVQSGDRFIRADLINVDNKTGKPSIADNMSIMLDRYDSKLLWGNMKNESKPLLQFNCSKIDQKF